MPAGNQTPVATHRKSNCLGTYYLEQWKMNKPCCTGLWFLWLLPVAPSWKECHGEYIQCLVIYQGLPFSPTYSFFFSLTHHLCLPSPQSSTPPNPCCLLKCDFWFLISTFGNVFLLYKCETKCCTMPPYQCTTLRLNAYTIHEIIFTVPEGGILTSGKICGGPKFPLASTTWKQYSFPRRMVLWKFYW